MFTINKMLVAVSAVLAGSATAAPVVLTFEGIGDQAAILDFYNGGTDSQGNSGPNYGISFGANALGIIDVDAGGSGNFANESSASTVMFFLTGSAVLNHEAGFDTGLAFYYSSAYDATVYVYSGLDATGTLLGSINLAAQHTENCGGDPQGVYCNFTAIGLGFAGTAHSIDFTGTADYVAFDNVTFGATAPVPARDLGDAGNRPARPGRPAQVLQTKRNAYVRCSLNSIRLYSGHSIAGPRPRWPSGCVRCQARTPLDQRNR